MNMVIEKLDSDMPDPRYALPGDGGIDCYSTLDVDLMPGDKINIPLGIKLQLPSNTVALVLPKSGLSFHSGLTTVTGLIDNGYRGEISMLATNISDNIIHINRYQKVCQIMIVGIPDIDITYDKVDTNTVRGDNGFGSTGLK